MSDWRILVGDCRDVLRRMPAGSVHTCVTSPPYFGLRDYGHDGQIGLEPTPSCRFFEPAECGECFVCALIAVFREVRRVLRDDGTVWLNLGDSYAGYHGNARVGDDPAPSDKPGYRENMRASVVGGEFKQKDLLGIPWLVAFALRADGWYLRSDIIWHKPNPMPESVTDRPTKAHEYLFLLSKGPRYYYDADGIREPGGGTDHPRSVLNGQPSLEPTNGLMAEHKGLRTTDGRNGAGRNKRSVWTVATQPYSGAHFATFPPKLIEPCILAGAPERACGTCGAPWVRHMAERGPSPEFAPLAITEGEALPRDGRGTHRNMGGRYQAWLDANPKRTLGFEPSCPHDDGSFAGVVLDPFAGSGAVGVVSCWWRRHFIGIELNPEYAEMARHRIAVEGERHGRVARAPEQLEGQIGLFNEEDA